MQRYLVVGPVVLSFLIEEEPHDVILKEGTIESDGVTVWYRDEEGHRYESITTPNVVSVGLAQGTLEILPV